MSVVVSANYRDRNQKNFLVRQESDPMNYELRDRVVIKDFKFCASFAGETGFGCQTVAVGETADESEINKESLIPIFFNHVCFREKESGSMVEAGSALVLDETGMYYVPA